MFFAVDSIYAVDSVNATLPKSSSYFKLNAFHMVSHPVTYLDFLSRALSLTNPSLLGGRGGEGNPFRVPEMTAVIGQWLEFLGSS